MLAGNFALSAADPEPPAAIFADKGLEKAVRQFVLEKRDTDKPLTEGDLANLSTIKGNGMNITNLAGLEKCVNLAMLELGNNKVTDLSSLKAMSKLQYLHLATNLIEDLSPLASVKALQYLELSHNQVKDVTPLQGLTNMASLYLGFNRIEDVAALAGLPRMSSIYLDHNRITTLPSGNKWRGLFTFSANDNSITSLQPIVNLTNLYWLMIENNKVSDLGSWPVMDTQHATNEFLPFLNLYIKGNPLDGAAKGKLKRLKEIGTKVNY